MWCLSLKLVFYLCLYLSVSGLKLDGTVSLGGNGFSFIGKFCFNDRNKPNNKTNSNRVAGKIDITLKSGKNMLSNTYFVMYDDESDSFRKVYRNGKSCSEKLNNNYAKIKERVEWIKNPSGRYIWKRNKKGNTGSINLYQYVRPRWWWGYIINCELANNKSIDKKVDYNVHYYQGKGTSWDVELGSNEQGLNTLYLIYLIIYIVLFGVQYYGYHIYKVQQYVHQVIKLLTSTIFVQLMGVLFHFIDYMILAETGKMEIGISVVATVLDILAACIFLLLLLVLAQGWTISRFEVYKPKLLLLIVIVVFLFQVSFLLWSKFGIHFETKYVYNSTPMYCFSIFMLIIGAMYLIICIKSYKNENNTKKKSLFVLLAAFFTLYFCTSLFVIMVGTLFDPWVRDFAMNTIKISWDTLTFSVMVFMMWPKWAHHYFNLSLADTQDSLVSVEDESVNKEQTFRPLDEERL